MKDLDVIETIEQETLSYVKTSSKNNARRRGEDDVVYFRRILRRVPPEDFKTLEANLTALLNSSIEQSRREILWSKDNWKCDNLILGLFFGLGCGNILVAVWGLWHFSVYGFDITATEAWLIAVALFSFILFAEEIVRRKQYKASEASEEEAMIKEVILRNRIHLYESYLMAIREYSHQHGLM
ncbi:hypothetical protein IJG91_02175 [Candidatus Saccharibacteria bacterium]|nr:hypothetical protein [Candidatus Saccharibacteria bacterium]